ncbi:hypothetical protein LguiA_001470 [Lonicera macranthoides]
MHWTAHDKGHFCADRKIIWFDASKNIFKEFPSPKPKNRDRNAIVGLGVLDGCACIARTDNNHNDFEGDVEVLTMKEYGVVESWTIMFVVSNVGVNRYWGGFTPLLLTKNGDVFVKLNDNEMVVYNIGGGSLHQIARLLMEDYLVGAVSFEKSLVSPTEY